MVKGLNAFRKYFEGYENQYVLIGGAACDVVFERNDTVSSLSAILLNDDYYNVLLEGKVVANGVSVLRPEYLILFKAKAYLDLKQRRENGEHVDSDDIKKHKKDVLRIVAEIILENVTNLPHSVKSDIDIFIKTLEKEPFDANSLKIYGLKNQDCIDVLRRVFG